MHGGSRSVEVVVFVRVGEMLACSIVALFMSG